MRTLLVVTSSAIAFAVAGCSKQPNPEVAPVEHTPAAAAQSSFRQIGACSLLTGDEIQSVQGDAVTGTTPSSGLQNGFPSNQCVFTTVTPVNSVGVVITQTGPKSSGRRVPDFWRETFHLAEGEKEGRKKEGDEQEEEGKKKSPPQPVAGLGEEAFWMGSQISSALYVLKGDSYIRISVGGAGDQSAKLEKSRKLVEFALKRL